MDYPAVRLVACVTHDRLPGSLTGASGLIGSGRCLRLQFDPARLGREL